jgi:hypothetical protein
MRINGIQQLASAALIISMASPAAAHAAQPADAAKKDAQRAFIAKSAKATTGIDAVETSDPRLSKEFSAVAIQALSALRDWRSHLAATLQSGYPLSETWIAADSDRATDSVALTVLFVSTTGDRAAQRELDRHYADLKMWSDSLIAANRELRLAQRYMSPTALQNDAEYQAIAGCELSLMTTFAKRRLADEGICRTSAAIFSRSGIAASGR